MIQTVIITKSIPSTPNCLFCGAPFEAHEIVAANGLRGHIIRSRGQRLDLDGIFHWFAQYDLVKKPTLVTATR